MLGYLITSAMEWRQLRLLEGEGSGDSDNGSAAARDSVATARGTGLLLLPSGGAVSNDRSISTRRGARASTRPSKSGSLS